MLKRLAAVLAGLIVAGSAMAQSPLDTIPPCLIVTPQAQNLGGDEEIVLGYYSPKPNGGHFTTTITLNLQQYITGQVTGTAKYESSEPVTGQPAVSLPMDFPIKGKVKGNTFKLKSKVKIAGGADHHSRTIGLEITGNSILDNILPAFYDGNDYVTTVPLLMNVKLSGLGGVHKGFSQVVEYLSENDFHYQLATNIFGLKPLPSNARYFDLSTSNGYYRVPGYYDSALNTLTFKGKKLKATVTFAPSSWFVTHLNWKSGTGTVDLSNPQFINAGFVVVDE